MPQPLDYMPQTYRSGTPAWQSWAGFTLFVAVVGFLVRWNAGTWNTPFHRVWILFPPLCAGGTLYVWWRDLGWECRVEGNVLSFRSFSNGRWQSVPIDRIQQIVMVEGPESRWYELILNGGGRIHVDWQVFGDENSVEPDAQLAAALLAVNPAIRFSGRGASMEGTFPP